MDLTTTLNQILRVIKYRNDFNESELAAYIGISRPALRRIRRGELGGKISTNLVAKVLQETSVPTLFQ